jgi:3',5'-cyclic AMP phosphodiesterase CpdA
LKILAVSDIHVEFDTSYRLPREIPPFDVAVFAGDMHSQVTAALHWIARERQDGVLVGKPVVYVPGNHEFYRGEIGPDQALPQAGLAHELGIHLLAPGTAVLAGVRFIGAILWTDYALLGDVRKGRAAAERGMNDHSLIRWCDGGRTQRFTTAEALRLHHRDRAYIETELARPFEGPTVVVTHHAPHPGSIAPRHQGSTLSPAFASDLSAVIVGFAPALWIHGHDHNSHDYRVGRTRVFSNQAGYPYQFGARENPDYDPTILVDLEEPPRRAQR